MYQGSQPQKIRTLKKKLKFNLSYRDICKHFGVDPIEELISVRQRKFISRYCASEGDVCRAISKLRQQNVCCSVVKACFERLVYLLHFLFFFYLLVKLFTLRELIALVNKDLHYLIVNGVNFTIQIYLATSFEIEMAYNVSSLTVNPLKCSGIRWLHL